MCKYFGMKEEFLMNYTSHGRFGMVLNIKAPVSLAGKPWLKQFLSEFNVKLGELSLKLGITICFGPAYNPYNGLPV